MNHKSILFFSFTAIFIFIITLVVFSVKIGLTSSNGKENSKEQFTLLVQKTMDLIETNNGINNNFCNTYVSFINQNDYIGSVIIKDTENVYFAHPLNSKLLVMDKQKQYTIQSNSSIISIYSSTIPLENNVSLIITAAFYHITPSTLYNYGRNCFMIILITTLAIFFILILSNILSNKNETILSQSISDPITETSKKNTTPSETSIVENFSPSEPTIESLNPETQNTVSEILPPEQQVNKGIPSLGEGVSDPLGLFSKETGFGWESYLETRLDSELTRAASSEQDLALIILRIKDLKRNHTNNELVSTILLETFKFRDLIFEYGEDGFACMIQEMDLDMAMKVCEKLYNTLNTLLIDKKIENQIGIGISTRTLRIIPGSRILQESTQACNKAFEEKGLPIVAFRVNPDKYRTFLSETDE